MNDTLFLQRCKTYIDCHMRAPSAAPYDGLASAQLPAVTVSRQTGAGGITIAHRLAAWLDQRTGGGPCPWTVFHKNLVERVLQDHNLPARLAQFMPEDKVSGIQDAMEELLGLHPASWNLVRQTTESILQLAELGNVILVGRGANIITAHLKTAFHVRLVGSAEKRALRVMEYHKLSKRAAAAYLAKEDAGRRRYIKRYFGKDVDDPLLYHLTINTDDLLPEQVVEIIGNAGLRKWSPVS